MFLYFASLDTWMYGLQQLADRWVLGQLTHLSPVSLGVLVVAGGMTSLTPCMLSMLPITLGYLGGYPAQTTDHRADEGHGSPNDRWDAAAQATGFALGVATTLAGLGIMASLLGRVYGQVGWGVSLLVGVVAIGMGLNLLELMPLQLPNWGGTDWIPVRWPRGVRSYAFGLTFGLVASPCSTPVLATLLAWISTTQDPVLGGSLLLAYAIGYVSPLIVAGTFAASLKKIVALRQWSGWINPASGVVLLGFGVFSLLTKVLTIFSAQG